jgi:hypothetical protein
LYSRFNSFWSFALFPFAQSAIGISQSPIPQSAIRNPKYFETLDCACARAQWR